MMVAQGGTGEAEAWKMPASITLIPYGSKSVVERADDLAFDDVRPLLF